MLTRDTKTGIKFENAVTLSLKEANEHTVDTQVVIGNKRNGRKHRVDIILDGKDLVSLKYQGVEGTAEEKVNHEFMKLQHAIDDFGYESATIVIDDPNGAWTWKDFYLSEEFKGQMKSLYPAVTIMDSKEFAQRYNLSFTSRSYSTEPLDE
jgi:hypothetical protein